MTISASDLFAKVSLWPEAARPSGVTFKNANGRMVYHPKWCTADGRISDDLAALAHEASATRWLMARGEVKLWQRKSGAGMTFIPLDPRNPIYHYTGATLLDVLHAGVMGVGK